MDRLEFEEIILRWVCLFDEFSEVEYLNIKDLISSTSFKHFVENVFCFKCSTPLITEDEKIFNTIKVNYNEFEVQKYEDLYINENAVYTCVVVLLHALLKCTNNKFRNQLSERMDNDEQILLAKFLETTQCSLFTKQNISEALMLMNGIKFPISNVSEIFSNNGTPIKTKRRSYLQEFCESPKSKSLIYQEKEKLIVKLTEDYKNECEENYKLAENIKTLQDLNLKLSSKLEDKDKVIIFLKEEIEEHSKPKESPKNVKVNNIIMIQKLNQDILDLEINNNELKQQILELENKNKELNGKFENKTSDYENLIFTFESIEAENLSLKENLSLLKDTLLKKDTEITTLKDELFNKSISNNPPCSNSQELAVVSSNTLFDELNCIKLEETTRDKEKYRHKYKLLKKDLLNVENVVKDLNQQLMTVKEQLHDCETYRNELIKNISIKENELQECRKTNFNLETKILDLKTYIKDQNNHLKSMRGKIDEKENKLKHLSEDIEAVTKAKNMFELILSKTNEEILGLHEEHDKNTNNLQTVIEEYKNSEELSHKNLLELENNIKKIQDDLANKENIIIFYEEKVAENYQVINSQEEQLKTMYEEKLLLESSLKSINTDIKIQQKMLNDKNREMENCLEYYLDELKDTKNVKTKLEEILKCKQNENDRQVELIDYQKSIIETLQTEKNNQEVIINNLNSILQQKTTENTELKEKVLEFTLNINKFKEKLNSAQNEFTILEKHFKINEIKMNISIEELQRQHVDMEVLLESKNNEINKYEMDFKTLKDDLEKKQNNFNDQLIINNKQIELISDLNLEKFKLEEKLKSCSQSLLNKTDDIKILEGKLINSELQVKTLTKKMNLKLSENIILTKNIETVISTVKHLQNEFEGQFLNVNNNLQVYDNKIDIQAKMLIELKKKLSVMNDKFKIQTDLKDKQKNYILVLETEKVDLLDKLKVHEQYLMNKDMKIINLEKELQNHIFSINNFKEQLSVMSIEKVTIETNLNETAEQFKNSQEQYTKKIDNTLTQLCNREEEIVQLKNKTFEIENILEKKQKELDKQLQLTLEQYEIIKNIKFEKEILEKQVINSNEHSIIAQVEIKSLKEKLSEYESLISKLKMERDSITKERHSFESTLKSNLDIMKITCQELDDQLQESKIFLKNSINENDVLKTNLIELKNNIDKKQVQLEYAIEENNKFKETINYTENQCINLQGKIKELNICLLKKEEDLNLLKLQNVEYLSINENLEKQIIEEKQVLNYKQIELENQIQFSNEQKDVIVEIKNKNKASYEKIEHLENTLSHKEYEFNLSEKKIYDYSNTINRLEKYLEEIKNEKISLELKLNETVSQLTNTNHDLALQLEVAVTNLLKTDEKIINKQHEWQNQIEQLNEQINILNTEKDKLLKKTFELQEFLNEKESVINLLQKKILIYEKQHEELQTLKINLESELDEIKKKLINVQHKSNQQVKVLENEYLKVQEKLNKKQVEIDEYISKYNYQVEKYNLLTSEKNNLINETNILKNHSLNKDNTILENQKKILEFEKLNNELTTTKYDLEVKLKDTNIQLETMHHELLQLGDMENKLFSLNEELNCKNAKLQSQLQINDEQMKTISTLISEKNNLINEVNLINDHLLEKESILASNHAKLTNSETQLKELQIQKTYFESELNETKIKLVNTQEDLNTELETVKKSLHEVEEQLIEVQLELNEQNNISVQQVETIKILTNKNNNLVDEAKKLHKCIAQNEEVKCQNSSLMLKLNQLKCELDSLRQETFKEIAEMNKNLYEAHETLNQKQSDIKKQIKLKNDSLIDVYHKINDLKNIKNNFELVFKKEKSDFEMCLETYLNSLNCINGNSIQDCHQESLMEVITSADTFIEQNGIQVNEIKNYGDYSIIERLKKLFEALKMFIININSQCNEQAILHNDNDYMSNEAYNELLGKYNKQLETITHLETEMSKLKSECNYKMTKVQQKTQEYITSEYEKKFERKREQMKQFCKDLETKIHQDYEAKLMKYKEKINKDEVHIKELGQQLWEVSEKYLKLQQKERRESTMSLPFEMSTITHSINSIPKYNSLSLPKSSSASQIRSFIEETRSNQDYSKRNVPTGIGKKFSLSSGKIFPKEEDEEGEMFNHSCLADLKQGKVKLSENNGKQYNERLSELQARNSLCPPHLRSCYAVETNFLPNSSLITEEDIKTTNYSDCESENLIPNDRNKKKDRSQTSYKKPGPPTPSKNGGRASLSNNTKTTLKESKEKESNVNKRRTSSTPNKLFSLFMSKKN